MNKVNVKNVRDYTFAAVLAGVMAMPVAAHADNKANKTDASITAEQKFSAMDSDRSGAISEAEFIAHMESQDKGPEEAANKFRTLDTDNDDRLTLAEVRNGSDAYRRTVQ